MKVGVEAASSSARCRLKGRPGSQRGLVLCGSGLTKRDIAVSSLDSYAATADNIPKSKRHTVEQVLALMKQGLFQLGPV